MLLTSCVTSATLAEDLKALNGKEFKNVRVIRVELDGIMLRTKFGISKVYFVELPKDVQKRFHYVDATGIGILGLTWLAFVTIGTMWLIFPFVVWAKLNLIIENTRTARQNFYRLSAQAQ